MRAYALVTGLVFWIGLAFFIFAAATVAYAQVAPVEGLQDLGRIVLSMLAVGVGGALLGLSLLLDWGFKLRPPGWRVAFAMFGCILAAIVAFGLIGAALPSNVWLAVFGGGVLLLAAGGLVASARLWRGSAAPM